MTIGHSFNGVSNQLTASQRVFHAIVAHSNTIANANGREFDGGTAGFQNTIFSCLSNGVQMHMAGDDFISGTANAD